MRSDQEAGGVRWEALSHAQIYQVVHTGQTGAASTLAETLPLWRKSVADLREIRSRFDDAVALLMSASAGAGADAAAGAFRLVTRGLADALELTELAGARRFRLEARNEQLRRSMPEPTHPVEHTSGFLLSGHGWLVPPDFDHDDAARFNTAEVARDQMREYEKDIATDILADDGYSWHHEYQGRPVDPGHGAPDAPTVQLSRTVASVTPTMDVPKSDARPAPTSDDGAVQPFGMGHGPRGSYDLDFGPRGHVDLDEDAFAGSEEPTAALGAPPPPRGYVEEAPRPRSNNPFEPDDYGFPPVIGI